jgi:hypothetical protein
MRLADRGRMPVADDLGSKIKPSAADPALD